MKFGKNELKYGLFLGPMAGVTDTVYRQLCQEQGCEVTYTEMVSAKAIYYQNKKTDTLLTIEENEFNVGIQLFGSDPELIGEMAKQIDNERITSFDVNMGCPVPKVVNNGEGSALMKNPKLIGEIVESLVRAVDKPVSIKIRTGFDEDSINAVEVSKIAENAGVSSIAIHGRTREQYYSGKANWDIIAQVKEAVNIPIIGNGDITSGKDLLAMKVHTNCDGFMVGRAAMGNPWIFNELICSINNEIYIKPSIEEIMKMILRHGEMLIGHKGEYVAMREMRKHVAWYTRGVENAAKLRHETNTIEKFEDLVKLVQKMLV